MIVQGLDTVGLIIMVIALALIVTYICWFGWKFQFQKRQFAFLMFFMLLFGMFVEAWIRGTGDELLVGLSMLGLFVLIIVLGTLRRRKRGPGGGA